MVYRSYGSFYKNNEILCRNLLVITSEEINKVKSFDLMVLMMNPGSSEPLNANISDTPNRKPSADISQLVPAKTDDTQKQIIQVMKNNNLTTACIINLSDVREAKSKRFLLSIKKKEHSKLGKSHSIFSECRREELNVVLKLGANCPVVVATGVDDKLKPLVFHALESFRDRHVLGLQKHNGMYYHALPWSSENKQEWVSGVSEMLGSKLTSVSTGSSLRSSP